MSEKANTTLMRIYSVDFIVYIYLPERLPDKIDSFYKLKHDIQSLYNSLLYGQKP
jgi:hypothetical protein